MEASAVTLWYPLFILVVGIATVLSLILVFRLNAFLALLSAALLVSFLGADTNWSIKVSRVVSAFGESAGNVGIIIALAAIIGQCMMDSGAADRIVRAFLNWLGEKRASLALMSSGYLLGIPVFFDTVFYLLIPLARVLSQQTKRGYLKYILAICAGGAITHTLVPPTPGPLFIASELDVDLGIMILVGGLVALPTAIVGGLIFAPFVDRWLDLHPPIPHTPTTTEIELPSQTTGTQAATVETNPSAALEMPPAVAAHVAQATPTAQLPPLWAALLPIVLPVLLIAINTGVETWTNTYRLARFQPADFPQPETFAKLLVQQLPANKEKVGTAHATNSTPAQRIVEKLPPSTIAMLQEWSAEPARPLTEAEKSAWSAGLNQVLLTTDLYTRQAWGQVDFGAKQNEIESFLKENRSRLPKASLEHGNRLLLELAFPEQIRPHSWDLPIRRWLQVTQALGNSSFALLLATFCAIAVLLIQKRLPFAALGEVVETALMSAGVIILITCAGGAFGAMLREVGVGAAIKTLLAFDQSTSGSGSTGIALLFLAWSVSAVLKIAQGSSTVAMITTAGMLGGTLSNPETLGFHPVYIATAIGSGSLVGSWMNDSGFWIVAKMSGLTETQTLKSWTLLLLVLGTTGFLTSLLLSQLLPLV